MGEKIETSILTNKISSRLKYYRNQARLSQREMAEKIGIKFRSYQNYEYGRAVPAEIIYNFCKALRISLDTFFGMDEKISNPASQEPADDSSEIQLQMQIISLQQSQMAKDIADIKTMLFRLVQQSETKPSDRP
ncbi:helix-turn-helix domain-containing protein [Selenomonas bovis]|uniref:helix-turn-helix domain-containing protein n=1 Tax=Selenomonas bovis TaxID=416586 RepID=UPI003D033CC9